MNKEIKIEGKYQVWINMGGVETLVFNNLTHEEAADQSTLFVGAIIRPIIPKQKRIKK